jgi:hypothetical protein
MLLNFDVRLTKILPNSKNLSGLMTVEQGGSLFIYNNLFIINISLFLFSTFIKPVSAGLDGCYVKSEKMKKGLMLQKNIHHLFSRDARFF